MAIWHSPPDLGALEALGAGTLMEQLGIRFVGYGDDWLQATMPVDARTRQPFGLLHGGASVALAETVSSVAGALVVDPALQRVVGMEINANHVRPVMDGLVTATAAAEALGRTSQVWTIRIVDARDRLACISRATLAVLSR